MASLNTSERNISTPASARAYLVASTLLILTGPDNAIAQENLQPPSVFEVMAGESRMITATTSYPVAVDFFIIRRGGKLVLDPTLEEFKITARVGIFEEGASIIGVGQSYAGTAQAGANGGNGGNCHTGKRAGDGAIGRNGLNGIPVSIEMGVKSFGSLLIDASGGDAEGGGRGGRGGTGGRADISEYCKGGSGGYGGRGGDGGRGGNGASVSVTWWPVGDLPKNAFTGNNLNGLTILSEGGEGGALGPSGPGGSGGPSRCKKITFIKTCRGSGPTGTPGKQGSRGADGLGGEINVSRVALP